MNPEEESAVEKETRKCSADLEERLMEITKQEIEKIKTISKIKKTMRLFSSRMQRKASKHC